MISLNSLILCGVSVDNFVFSNVPLHHLLTVTVYNVYTSNFSLLCQVMLIACKCSFVGQ